jgi:hypothetical protein
MTIEIDKMTLFRDMSSCGDAVQYIYFYESFQRKAAAAVDRLLIMGKKMPETS